MTDQILDPQPGTLARAVVRIALLAATALGITAFARLTPGQVLGVQAALEVALIVATAIRQYVHHRPVSFAQVIRAVIRPLTVALVLVRVNLSADQLLLVVAGIEAIVQASVRWWRSDTTGPGAQP